MNNTDYEIFISFKDRDDNGNRTESSHLAERIYNSLDVKNYCVFFSRETMNNSASKEFELEIDCALKTSKLLILVFTKADELHSEWVKKEWKEFLKSDKSIIPVFMNLPVGDMSKVPDDIRRLQGFDLSFDDDYSKYDELISQIVKIMQRLSSVLSNIENNEYHNTDVSLSNHSNNTAKKKTSQNNENSTNEYADRRTHIVNKVEAFSVIKTSINRLCVLGVIFSLIFPILIYYIRIKGNDADYLEQFSSILVVKYIMTFGNGKIHFLLSIVFIAVMLIVFRLFHISNEVTSSGIISATFGIFLSQVIIILIYSWINPPLNTILEQSSLFFPVYIFCICTLYAMEDNLDDTTGFIAFFVTGVFSFLSLLPSFTLLIPRWWGFIISEFLMSLIAMFNIILVVVYDPKDE